MFDAKPETDCLLANDIQHLGVKDACLQVPAVDTMTTMRAFCRLSNMLYSVSCDAAGAGGLNAWAEVSAFRVSLNCLLFEAMSSISLGYMIQVQILM